jgi:hypothetical protein
MYDGYSRVVEPHCYGIITADHHAIVGYQIRGLGVHNSNEHWHLFVLTKISNLQLLDETFPKPRDGYKKGDKRMNTIFCEL